MQPTDYIDWLRAGIEAGYCTHPACATHDGIPTTADEDNELADGYDPCMPVVRLCDDKDQQQLIANNNQLLQAHLDNRSTEQ